MNIDFNINCIRADPQAGICEVGGSGGSGSSSSANNSATVRGSTFPVPAAPSTFQSVVPFAPTGVQFGSVVLANPSLVWNGSPNYRYDISTAGNYLLSFGLCASNTLSTLSTPNDQIFEFAGFFRIFDSTGTFKADVGKAIAYGGISPAINSIAGTSNFSNDITVGSSVIYPLAAGDRVQVFTIFGATNNGMATLSLIDPSLESTSPASGSVNSSWFSITSA